MNFDLQPEIEEYRSKVREFVNEHIIPLENDRTNYDHHENIAPDVLLKIQKQVKQAGPVSYTHLTLPPTPYV